MIDTMILQGGGQQDGRPAYVTFETRAIEDRNASIEAGHPVYKDVDFAIITPPGGASTVIERPAHKFIASKTHDQFGGHYQAAYDAWKAGQEPPVEGTHIKMWPPIGPAQAAACIAANVRTVEDLAQANDYALGRIGPMGRALQAKAAAWLDQAADSGKVAEEVAALKLENDKLKQSLEDAMQAIQELKADDAKPVKRGPGRPRKTDTDQE